MENTAELVVGDIDIPWFQGIQRIRRCGEARHAVGAGQLGSGRQVGVEHTDLDQCTVAHEDAVLRIFLHEAHGERPGTRRVNVRQVLVEQVGTIRTIGPEELSSGLSEAGCHIDGSLVRTAGAAVDVYAHHRCGQKTRVGNVTVVGQLGVGDHRGASRTVGGRG